MLERNLSLYLGLIVSFAFACVLTVRSDQLLEFKPKVVPPKELNHFHFGFNLALANSLWLRALQADDFCESNREKSFFNAALLLEDVLKAKMTPSRCHMGWVYQMFDLITDLNPKFKWVYKMGGVQLSIGVDDREGARLIFEKGIALFPDDWQLLYRAAYHYIFEVQDAKRAGELLLMAAKHPDTPPVIHLLAARLASVTGKGEMAISILEEYIKTQKEGSEGYIRSKARIEELRKILARHTK